MSSANPRPAAAPERAEWMSAAIDGDADALERACRAFRDDDGAARADWHAYHLIGDVLRSSELASASSRDQDFVARLRERLAAEPVVLAPVVPVAPAAAAPRPSRWRVPAVATAAGVAVVAGVLVMARPGSEAPGATAVPLAAAPPLLPRAEAPPLVRDGVIRDARIEEFMRLHQGAVGGLSLPRVDVRQVDLVVAPAPQR
jgi:sigma-E factor negative regulatory protein RseA